MSKRLLIDYQGTATLELNEDKNGVVKIRGEFGKADIPTANGRIYPRKLWEREIEKIKPLMKDGMVMGHLNHPCLLDDDFRVLTVDGWKNFREIKPGDKVWSRVNGEAIPSIVEKIIDQPYVGHAYKFNMRHIQSGFTPQHKIMLLDRNYENEFFVTAEELVNNLDKYSHNPIPKKAKFFSENQDKFVIYGTNDNIISKCKNDVSKDLVFDSKVFSAFMGIYLSEGSCSSESSDNYAIIIHQKNKWSKKYIYDEILSKFPDELKWSETKSGFYLADARLYNYLIKLGDAYTKKIPSEIKKLSHDCLRELLFWFSIGDGRITATGEGRKSEFSKDESTVKQNLCEEVRNGNVKYINTDVFSVSKKLIQDLHECLVLSGGSGSLQTIVSEKDYTFAGRTIKAENKVPLYQLHISTGEFSWIKPEMDIEKIQHDGNIFCLQTQHGNFYMEQYGKSFWTGNSNGKTDLKEIAIIMNDLYIEPDGRVVGEATIVDNAHGQQYLSITKAGGKVGVSSRGMGSTKMGEGKYSGHEIVDDDYEYMTHDLVADPAVKTSYPKIVENVKKDVTIQEVESKEIVMEAKTYTEEELNKKLEEQRLAFDQQLEAKTVEIKESIQKELIEKQEKSEIVQLKEHFDKVLPLLKPEVTDLTESKDKEIADLKLKLEEKDKEIKLLQDGAKEIVEGAKRIAMSLTLEREINLMESEYKADFKEFIGESKQYKTEADLSEAVKKAKKKIADKKKLKAEAKKKMEDVERRFQKQLAESNLKIKKLEEDAKKKDEILKKSLQEQKKFAAQTYVEKMIQGNPNAHNIRKLCEGKSEKVEIDKIINEYRVDTKVVEEYNLIRNRIAKLDAVKQSTLVEDQIKKANGDQKPDNKIEEGVDSEIAEVTSGF